MIDALLYLLEKALLWDSNRRKYWYLTMHALLALIVDVIAAHTSWAKIAGKPRREEWTISQTLERLCHTDNAWHPDYLLFVSLARRINRSCPTGRHIKIVA